FRIAQSIKIKMKRGRLQVFVRLNQGIGGALDSPLMPQPPHESATQGGFAHPQVTLKKQCQALTAGNNRPGQPSTQGNRSRLVCQLKLHRLFRHNCPSPAPGSHSAPATSAAASREGIVLITSVGNSPMYPCCCEAWQAAARCSAAAMAAASGASPSCASRLPASPLSTSPIPPVAMPGLLPLMMMGNAPSVA